MIEGMIRIVDKPIAYYELFSGLRRITNRWRIRGALFLVPLLRIEPFI